jgi:hypothetical protein
MKKYLFFKGKLLCEIDQMRFSPSDIEELVAGDYSYQVHRLPQLPEALPIPYLGYSMTQMIMREKGEIR